MKLTRLTAPAFLAALLLLLANDFVLKAAWPNWLTGKLSDVAGLFAWGFFWCVVLPSHQRLVLAANAAAFIFWKSPGADGFLTWINAVQPFGIGRVVDPTDLVALVMLPLAGWSARNARPLASSRLAKTVAILCSVFAFTATSTLQYVTVWPRDAEFVLPRSQTVVVAELDRRGYLSSGTSPVARGKTGDLFEFRLKDWPCGAVSGRLELWERDDHTFVQLRELRGSTYCIGEPDVVGHRGARDAFKDYFVRPLENWLRSTDTTVAHQREPDLAQVVGCYSIRLGRWHPKADKLLSLHVVPTKLRLTDSLGSRGYEGYAGRRVVQSFEGRPPYLWWEPIGGDSVRVAGTWHDHDGVEVRFPRLAADSAIVVAQTFDESAGPRLTARTVVRRIACPSDR